MAVPSRPAPEQASPAWALPWSALVLWAVLAASTGPAAWIVPSVTAGLAVTAFLAYRTIRTIGRLRSGERKFRHLTTSSPIGVFHVGPHGERLYVNPRLCEIAGIDPDDGSRLPLTSIVHPDDLPAVARAWFGAAARDGRVSTRFRAILPDGQRRWLALQAVALRDPAGTLTGWIGSVDDVHDDVEAQLRSDRLTAIVEATTDLVVVADARCRPVYANDAALHFRGISSVAEMRDAGLGQALAAARADGVWSGDTTMRAAGGEEVPVSVVVLAHAGDDGEPAYYSCIARDTSERLSFERRLVHDPLTGLANRVLFVDRLEHALARSDRRTSTLAVICLDLDRFKVVNDSLGHDVGDELLVAVAERLGYVLRDEDSAARFGSDEFVLLCEDIRSEEQAMTVVARVRAAFAKPFLLRGTELHVTACIGLALATREHHRPSDVLRDAAAALSRAKERGSAHVELFDEEMRQRAVRRLELGTALHRAVEQGELRVHYQPEVNLVDGSISGLEALVRWDHPLEGLLGPTEFIPLAEDSGLIDAIGEFVFADACEQAVRWNRVTDRQVTVWVNLSARQLAGPDIVARIASIMAAKGADPSTLGLEITESVLFDDVDAAVETLRQLRGLGVRLGVDDFGTGYSSLTYLKRLPVEMVKIDRTFVDGVGADPESTAIVAAVVSMARALGLVTVAEGAETARQIAALRTLGCSVAQGFYFSPPSDPEVVESLLLSTPPPWAETITEPLKAPPAAPAPIPSQRAAPVTPRAVPGR